MVFPSPDKESMKTPASLDHSNEYSGSGDQRGSGEKIRAGGRDFSRDPKARPTKKKQVCFFVGQEALLNSDHFTVKRLFPINDSAREEGFFRQELRREGTIENKTSSSFSIR
jgi:hypothetical protein